MVLDYVRAVGARAAQGSARRQHGRHRPGVPRARHGRARGPPALPHHRRLLHQGAVPALVPPRLLRGADRRPAATAPSPTSASRSPSCATTARPSSCPRRGPRPSRPAPSRAATSSTTTPRRSGATAAGRGREHPGVAGTMVRAAGARHPRMRCARRGGCSSAGRAPGCGPGGRGFKSRHSPHVARAPACSTPVGGSAVSAAVGSAASASRRLRGWPACRRVAFAAVVTSSIVVALPSSLAVALGAFARPRASAALPLHARLLSSTPADGSTVEAATEVVLAFNGGGQPRLRRVR